jgi:asparagine synthase (glutamine-hydrolysing)
MGGNLPQFDEDYVKWYKQGKTDVISPWSTVKNIPIGCYVQLKFGTDLKEKTSENKVSMQTCEWALNLSTLTFSEIKEKTELSWDSFSSVETKAPQIQVLLDSLPRVSEKAEVLRKQLFLSIARRLQSDVPIGFALSGGLDSSAIAAIACLVAGKETQLRTFSIASSNTAEDESKWQRKMSEFLGTQHQQIETRGFLSSDLPEFIEKTGRPAVHWNNIAHFNLCKTVKETGITVLFNGQGADEIFAGYPHYYVRQLMNEWTSLIPHRKKWPLPLSVALRQRLKMFLTGIFQVENLQLSLRKNNCEVNRKNNGGGNGSKQRDTLYDVLLNDYFGDRLNQLLRFEDRNGMANQLESRNPFADDYLLSQWIGISALDEQFEEEEGYIIGELSSRLYSGYSKGLLREALTGILPDEILYRTDKKGFTVPHTSLTLLHFSDWEEAILGVEKLNTWWDFEFRKKEFNKGTNAELLFTWASLGYFFKFADLSSGDLINDKVQ